MASITAVVDSIIHVAIELSQSTWLVAARLPQANKPKVFRVPGGQAPALLALLSSLRGRLATRACPQLWKAGVSPACNTRA